MENNFEDIDIREIRDWQDTRTFNLLKSILVQRKNTKMWNTIQLSLVINIKNI